MIRVACPKCAKPLGLPDSVAGKPVKCPSCQQAFIAPAGKKQPAPAAPAVNKPHHDDFEEATPYALRPEEQKSEEVISAQNQDVDDMVITARRNKNRNKAWEAVGLPAKFVKRMALVYVVFWLFLYLFLTMVIVLAAHNIDQASREVTISPNKESPKYLFVTDMFRAVTPQRLTPVVFWLVITGGFVVAMTVYGLQLAGAEKMKKLEGYGLAMFAMVVGSLTINLFAIWGLIVLLNKDIQYEFRVSARRLQGLIGEDLYDEGEEEEEDQEEETEEEEEERPARRR